MQFSKEALNEFRQIYREDLGITLTDKEALELATSFYTLMQTVYRPLPDESCTRDPGVLP